MTAYILDNPWIIILVLLWSIPWKGLALWKSARRGDAGWFIVLLVVNTLALLEILYIFLVGRNNYQKRKATGNNSQH